MNFREKKFNNLDEMAKFLERQTTEAHSRN